MLFNKNQLFVRALAYEKQSYEEMCKSFGNSFVCLLETVQVVYGLIMINQYQLMSHMTVHQAKIDRFVLGTTSKYITNYIEQRKALILAKLTRNKHQSDKISDETIELNKNMHIQYHERGGFKQERKEYMPRRKPEVLEFQRANKINKNGHFHRNNGTDEFLFRSSMYQKQRHLNLGSQKRKQLYTQASSHKFQPQLPKKDEPLQSKQTERKKQKSEESYQLKHDKKYSKKQENERISYKDLIRQSITKFDETKLNSITVHDQKERWKKIQEIFEKVKPNPIYIYLSPKAEEQNTTKNIDQKEVLLNYLHDLQANQLKLTLKKVESEERNIKGFMDNLQMQQHFEQDLSGILMDDDLKEQVDSSHVFQNVVKEMMLESEVIVAEMPELKYHEQIEIAQCVSILGPEEEEKQEQIAVNKRDYEIIEVREDEWIKRQEDEQIDSGHIGIKRVESQIIQDSQVEPQEKNQQLLQSKVLQYIEPPKDIQEEHHSVNESLIDQLSDQMIVGEAQKEQVVRQDSINSNERQKQSLQTLANQFMLLDPNPKKNDQDDDLSIPDEQSPSINIETFDFNTVSHEFIAGIINNITPLQSIPLKEEQNQPQENEPNQQYQQKEQTTQQIQEQQQVYHEEPRTKNVIRTLLSLGEFLVIPEQSDQQSHQSLG